MSPEQQKYWIDWERDHKMFSRTTARCTGCGRGYIWIPRAGVGCHACGEDVLYWTYQNGGRFLSFQLKAIRARGGRDGKGE